MTDPEILLYLRPGWSSLFPHILLHEQNLSFSTIGVIDRTVTEDPSFARQNPKKQIPVLIIDGRPVTENPAIANAIQILNPANGTMGQGTDEFIRVCEWLNWISASFHGQVWSPYLRPWRFTTDPGGEAAVKARAYEKLCERFAMVESWLVVDQWAAGEGFTAWADRDLELDVRTELPKYSALVEKVLARPAVQKAMKREAEIKEEMGREGAFEGNR